MRDANARSMWQAPDGATACYYCGAVAETIDHVVPQIVLQAAALSQDESVRQYFHKRHRIMTVPACTECNSLVGPKYFDTLAERRDYARERLRRRYRRYIETPSWEPSSLMDLDSPLRGYVLNALEIRRLVLLRLSWKWPAQERTAA